ncbi:MAG: DUF1697 domain-containing protein [Thermoplasmata archaeon]|nr:DUF1697 domain-containing protein [Thermoplasmata archaeon]
MTTFVALLRAVNLGGSTQVRMADLQAELSRRGLEDVRTLLQSGNVVFQSRESSAGRMERMLNRDVVPRLAARTEFFVRDAAEWRQIVTRNPFVREAEEDPGRLVVAVLHDAPADRTWSSLEAAIPGRERVRGMGRHAYLVYPDGQGRSKVSPQFIEKHLGTRGTNRNWNTVRKLDALASGAG